MSVKLKNTTDQGIADKDNYGSAALLTEIPDNWGPEAQFTCRHLGTTGYWYLMFRRTTGPTTTVYSKKLGPGEPFTERNPPKGEIWALTDANNDLSWYIGGFR